MHPDKNCNFLAPCHQGCLSPRVVRRRKKEKEGILQHLHPDNEIKRTESTKRPGTVEWNLEHKDQPTERQTDKICSSKKNNK